MKRFYKNVSTQPVDGGHALLLDNRSVKTPLRAPLVLPSEAMADAIAEEWDAQGEEIIIASMPLTGFANAAIDQVAPHRDRFVDDIAAYGETDTLCYRADPGDPLAERQGRDWEPILQWAENRYDIKLIRVAGIIHQPQSTHSLSRLRTSVNAMDAFALAGFSTLVGIGGSLVSALALSERAFDSGTIWQAICLEELWQEELWGADAEAVAARAHRRAAFDAAWRFCCTVSG